MSFSLLTPKVGVAPGFALSRLLRLPASATGGGRLRVRLLYFHTIKNTHAIACAPFIGAEGGSRSGLRPITPPPPACFRHWRRQASGSTPLFPHYKKHTHYCVCALYWCRRWESLRASPYHASSACLLPPLAAAGFGFDSSISTL